MWGAQLLCRAVVASACSHVGQHSQPWARGRRGPSTTQECAGGLATFPRPNSPGHTRVCSAPARGLAGWGLGVLHAWTVQMPQVRARGWRGAWGDARSAGSTTGRQLQSALHVEPLAQQWSPRQRPRTSLHWGRTWAVAALGPGGAAHPHPVRLSLRSRHAAAREKPGDFLFTYSQLRHPAGSVPRGVLIYLHFPLLPPVPSFRQSLGGESLISPALGK